MTNKYNLDYNNFVCKLKLKLITYKTISNYIYGMICRENKFFFLYVVHH